MLGLGLPGQCSGSFDATSLAIVNIRIAAFVTSSTQSLHPPVTLRGLGVLRTNDTGGMIAPGACPLPQPNWLLLLIRFRWQPVNLPRPETRCPLEPIAFLHVFVLLHIHVTQTTESEGVKKRLWNQTARPVSCAPAHS